MAHSGATHRAISPATVISGAPIIEWCTLVATDNPGTWGYFSAARAITKYATAASDLKKPVLVEFKPRGSAASARKDVDDNYATTDAVPIVIGGKLGPLTVVGKCADPGADTYSMHNFEAGSTAGSLTKAAWRSHGGLTGDGILNAPSMVWNQRTVLNTHTFFTALMY
jgi:hypothetical protein